MGKILESFANDNLCIDPVTYEGNADYRAARDLVRRLSEQFSAGLNEEERVRFDRLIDALNERNHHYSTDRFIRGYRLGVLMTLEVFDRPDSFLQNGT